MALVRGTSASETINALDGVTNDADQIFGYGGNDWIYGLGGNDVIKGGGGADHIYGGAGIDTVEYTDSLEGVLISLMTGKGFFGTAHDDTLNGIENVRGSNYGDLLGGDNSANVLSGMNGDDTLNGMGDNDELWGGDGIDTLYGGEGDDDLNGGSHGDFLYGEAGNDYLDGWTGDDTLEGGDGHDTLDGGAGIDQMIGGIGDDTYFIDTFADVVTEYADQGVDVVYAFDSYQLTANIETLALFLGTGIIGAGNDQNNTIFGNSGTNVLDGFGGADILDGWGGDDLFFFQAGQAQDDTVLYFDGNGADPGDQLRFVGYGPGASFVNISGNLWEINSVNGNETITINLDDPNTPVDPSDWMFV